MRRLFNIIVMTAAEQHKLIDDSYMKGKKSGLKLSILEGQRAFLKEIKPFAAYRPERLSIEIAEEAFSAATNRAIAKNL